jgi:hypothetical protein
MAQKKSLFLNPSNSCGIPNHIYKAITDLEPEFDGNWRVSLITDQTNELWTLKLTLEHGKQQQRNLAPEWQNVQGIRRVMRELRNAAKLKNSTRPVW